MWGTKTCKQCRVEFSKPPKLSGAQWTGREFCSLVCKNTWTGQQQSTYIGDWGVGDTKRQRASYRYMVRTRASVWAGAWEERRRREDLEELARPSTPGPSCKVSARPRVRTFIAGPCLGCGDGWVDYLSRKPSGFCNLCQKRRWAAHDRHTRRMRMSAQLVEVVSHDEVFKRDGYVCQLCGEPTKGKHPDPRSPTLDHIIPLSKGGEHSYANTQCACWICNTLKGDRIDDAQLRLIG